MPVLHPLRKTFLMFCIGLIAAILAVFIAASPICKYLIETYDERYTGRKILVGKAFVNPLTGYIRFSQLSIHEQNSDSVFIHIPNFKVNLSLHKLFSKTLEFTNLTLIRPKIVFIKNDSAGKFNFSDLLTTLFPKSTDTLGPKLHFNLRNINIWQGQVYYHENKIPIHYYIKELSIYSEGVLWDSDTLHAQFAFAAGLGSGKMWGDIGFHLKNLNYRLEIEAQKFDLNIIDQYLKTLINYGNFSASIDAKLHSKGNFKEPEAVTNSGSIAVNDFHFGKSPGNDYLAFKKLSVQIIKMSPKQHIYLYDTIAIDRPFFKYERYDSLDNIQTMFGHKGANIVAANANTTRFNLILEIAKYMEKLSKNFFTSNYKISRFELSNGQFIYDDYTLNEKFRIALDPFSLEADSIFKTKSRVKLKMAADIKPYGHATAKISINPIDSSDFDLNYTFQNMSLAAFNPYLLNYTSFPFNRGVIKTEGVWHVKNGVIASRNHILILDPRLAARSKNKGLNHLPLPFIMAFLKERGNVLDYEIPITRKIENPKFHFRDVIFDVLENMVLKPPTVSYRQTINHTEKEIENSVVLRWEWLQNTLNDNQSQLINELAIFLKNNPGSKVHIYPMVNREKELEHLLLFEAKKKYVLSKTQKSSKILNKSDSLMVTNLSIHDSGFTAYLETHCKQNLDFTIQSKCQCVTEAKEIKSRFQHLVKEREKVFMAAFLENGTANQITFHAPRFGIPFNGLSEYTIAYPGLNPESLINAYLKLLDFDNKVPRAKYKKDRKKLNTKP